ncbi:MAG: type II secretion system F family protein [Cohaesibacter sp.]|nr:type II secretion system F family protein [Cohaesibacter sp.]MCV6601681.1 type II secretion system F family protein [Cohaesibacter sp.]
MDFLLSNMVLTLALFGLVVFSIIGVLWGIFYPKLSQTAGRDKRMQAIQMSRVQMADKRVKKASIDRRKDIEDNLKKIEEKENESKKKKLTLPARLEQAGLTITPKQFMLYSAICSFVCFFLALLTGMGIYIAIGMAIVGFIGLPNFWLSRRRKKRLAKFIKEFPNAVDVIVRGVKTGLPLGDCIAIAATETAEPVAGEFKKLVDEQALGLSLAAVMPRLYERVPIAETNFLGIVIAIQSQAGGSLAEALGNLSKVLRARAQMKEKIGAMSMEAKASAAIIGIMPFIIALMTYFTSPDYIMVMFNHQLGWIVMGATLVWMGIGVVMMRNMINFEI